MIIETAQGEDIRQIAVLDSHIPTARLSECIANGLIYVLKDDSEKSASNGSSCDFPIVGVLRFSLFWQTIPFLDLIYLAKDYRGKGYGTQMMLEWEKAMRICGFKYIMTSTQADEDAWKFYEKLGFYKAGGFFPPEQQAEELIYLKQTGDSNEQ